MSPLLVKGLRAVVRGTMGVYSSYMVGYARGFCGWNLNVYLAAKDPASKADQLSVFVHNDDKHSYREVTDAFMGCGLSTLMAAEMTEAVDKEGQKKIFRGTPEQVKPYFDVLVSHSHLLVSIVPDELVNLTPKLHAVTIWLTAVAQFHDGIRRVIVKEMVAPVGSAPLGCNAFDPNSSKSYVRGLGLTQLFSDETQFPLKMPYLDDLHQSFDGYGAGCDTDTAGGGATEPVVDITAYPYPSESYRFYHPFVHGHEFASNCLGLLTLCSPLLPKVLQTNLCESLIVTYQHDAIFKTAYGQIVTLLFPCLHALYMRTIGTEKDSIFNTTVQMYTADSVVETMSSHGAVQRHFPEHGAPAHITSVLVRTLVAALIDMKYLAKTSKSNAAGLTMTLLENHVLTNRKLWKLFRCIEYVTTNPVFAAQVLGGQRDPSTVDDWLRVCSIVQCLYRLKRATVTHVAQETEHWQVAMNLILEIDGVSAHIIGKALFAAPNLHSSTRTSDLSREYLGSVAANAFGKCVAAIHAYFTRTEADTVSMGAVSSQPIFNRYIVQYPAYLLMHVSRSYVSINIPLHRFAGKVVHFSASSGLDLSQLVSCCKNNPVATIALLDYPLQCLSFVSQVQCEMWRRNGSSVANMMYNYQRAPLCRSLRDIDIVAVQTAAVGLGGDVLIGLALARFEVVFPFPQRDHSLLEYNGALLGELLRLLIHVVTHVPVVLKQVGVETESVGKDGLPETWEGVNRALRREVVHIIMGGGGTGKVGIGILQGRVKHLLGTDNFISDSMVKNVVLDMCVQKQSSGGGLGDGRVTDDEGEKVSTELFPVEMDYFDPEQFHLSGKERQMATDRIREHRKKEISTSGVADPDAATVLRRRKPVIHAIALPIPHPTFATMRSDVLFRPLFCSLLMKSVDTCIDSPKLVDKSIKYIVGRVIHLVTLQLHCSAMAALQWGGSAEEFPAIDTLSGSQLFFTFAFDGIHKSNIDQLSGDNNNVNSSSNGSEDPVSSGAGAGSGGYTTEQRGCVQAYWNLFMTLMRLWDSGLMQHDEYYWEGLEWIFQEICERSGIANEYLSSTRTGLNFASEKAIQDALKKEQAAKRKRAQQRMTSRISALASNFVVPAGFESSDGEDEPATGNADEESDLEDGAEMPVLDDHENLCIICQERKPHSSIGSLGFLQPSTMIRSAVDSNPDCPELSSVYRVVALDGCRVYSVPSTGQAASKTAGEDMTAVVGQLSQGEHLVCDQRVGVWCHITVPAVGWVPMYRYSTGAPDSGGSSSLPGLKLPVLLPVTKLQHNVFGGARVHVSTCGHMMHYGCYDAFYSGCLQKSLNHFATEEIMDVKSNNLFCPMCKSISNILIPHTPSKVARTLLPAGGVGGPQKNKMVPLVGFVAPEVCFPCGPANANTAGGASGNAGAAVRLADMLRHDCVDCSGRAFTLSIEAKQLAESCVERGFILSTQAAHDNYTETVAWERSHLGVKVSSAKSLYALWAAAAYTLLSATCSDRWCTVGDSSASSSTSSSSSAVLCPDTCKAIDLTRALLMTIRQAPAWFNANDPDLFKTSILDPLVALLLPCGLAENTGPMGRRHFRIIDANCVSSEDAVDMLLHLPITTVYSSSNSTSGNTASNPSTTVYPSHLRVSCNIALLQRVESRSDGTAGDKSADDFDMLGSAVVYPALLKPLLSQDLHTIALALAGAGTSVTDAVGLLQLLCTARLCQLLIEPLCTGLVPSVAFASEATGKDSAAVAGTGESGHHKKQRMESGCDECCQSPVDSHLATLCGELRGILIAQAGLMGPADEPPVDRTRAPSGQHLLRIVVDSWTPFLEFASALMHCVRTAHAPSSEAYIVPVHVPAASDTNGDVHVVSGGVLALLSELGIDGFHGPTGSLGAAGHDQFCIRMYNCAALWGHAYMRTNSYSTGDELSTLTTSTTNDRGLEAERLSASPVRLEAVYTPGDFIPKPYGNGSGSGGDGRISIDATSNGIDQAATSSSVVGPEQTAAALSPSTSSFSDDTGNGAHLERMESEEDEEGEFFIDEEYLEGPFEDADDDELDSGAIDGYLIGHDAAETQMELVDGESETLGLVPSGSAEFLDYDRENVGLGEGEVEGFDEESGGSGSCVWGKPAGNRHTRGKYVDLVLMHTSRRQSALANASSASASSSSSGAAAAMGVTGDLDAVGVDPIYNTVDACVGSMFDSSVVKGKSGSSSVNSHSITCAHSRTPFQGSVSGTAIINGLHGESLSNGYQDLSHMGLGLRHRLRLIELPALYTSAYQQVGCLCCYVFWFCL